VNVRTDADRTEKYTAKYVATTVGLKIASRLAGMKTGYAGGITQLVAYELQTQGILNSSGVMGMSRAGYYNFVREIAGKEFRGSAGAALKADAAILETKYVAYGFDDGILKDCALDIFGITIP
jgi:hypothetical protein